MSCETSPTNQIDLLDLSDPAPAAKGDRRSQRAAYAAYREIFGVCDNTARGHLDHGTARPDLAMLGLAFAAFGVIPVLRALYWGVK